MDVIVEGRFASARHYAVFPLAAQWIGSTSVSRRALMGAIVSGARVIRVEN